MEPASFGLATRLAHGTYVLRLTAASNAILTEKQNEAGVYSTQDNPGEAMVYFHVCGREQPPFAIEFFGHDEPGTSAHVV